jgi:hypothetical protein
MTVSSELSKRQLRELDLKLMELEELLQLQFNQLESQTVKTKELGFEAVNDLLRETVSHEWQLIDIKEACHSAMIDWQEVANQREAEASFFLSEFRKRYQKASSLLQEWEQMVRYIETTAKYYESLLARERTRLELDDRLAAYQRTFVVLSMMKAPRDTHLEQLMQTARFWIPRYKEAISRLDIDPNPSSRSKKLLEDLEAELQELATQIQSTDVKSDLARAKEVGVEGLGEFLQVSNYREYRLQIIQKRCQSEILSWQDREEKAKNNNVTEVQAEGVYHFVAEFGRKWQESCDLLIRQRENTRCVLPEYGKCIVARCHSTTELEQHLEYYQRSLEKVSREDDAIGHRKFELSMMISLYQEALLKLSGDTRDNNI